MSVLVEGQSRPRRQWSLDVAVLALAACVLLPAIVALSAVPWARGLLAWTLPVAAAAGLVGGLLLVTLPVYRRWWLVLVVVVPALAATSGAGALVVDNGVGAAQSGVGTLLLGMYAAALGAATPWLVFRAKQPWLAVMAAWISVAGAWGAHLSAQQVWWLILLLVASVVLLGMAHLREEKRVWDANNLQRLGPVLWPAARTIAAVSALVAVVGLLPLGISQVAALSSLWTRTPAGQVGPLKYTSPSGTPVAALGAPLSLGAPDVTSNDIVVTYTVLEGPIATPPLLGATLDTFDGTTWSIAPGGSMKVVKAALTSPEGARHLKAQLTAYALPADAQGTYLLGFDQPLSFSVPATTHIVGGDVADPVTVTSWQAAIPLAQHATYTTESVILSDDVTSAATLPAAIQRRMVQIPAPADPNAIALAKGWIGTANTTRAQAEALLAGLTKSVSFDATAAPPAGADVVAWTLQHKRGNALTLTTTYILLGRSLGLPMRLAEGYLPGTFDAKLKQMVVRGSDAAVWAQLAIPGAGWFDLFPAANELDISVPSKIVYKGNPTPTPTAVATKPADRRSGPTSGSRDPRSGRETGDGSNWLAPVLIAVIFLLLVTVALSFIRWKWSRFGAQLAPLGRFFARVGLLARLGGIALRASDTSTQATSKVTAVVTTHADALVALNDTYERARYGPATARGALPNLREHWQRLRGALWRLVLTRPWRHRSRR